MKIYFTAAISKVNPQIRNNYNLIINHLEKMGNIVMASHLSGKNAAIIQHQSEEEALAIQKKLSKWKKRADLVVVEGSTPSFGVGQEIMEAINDNKQVVVLYQKNMKPHILRGANQDAIYMYEYTKENLPTILKDALDYAKSRSDTRFNFFISPQIGAYLDWIAKTKRIPRAVYLRRLIENDMRNNSEYNGND